MNQSNSRICTLVSGWFGMDVKVLAGMAAISLLLSACGGSGGGGAPSVAGGNPLDVVPVKGKFGAGCAVSVSNPAGSFTAQGSTDATGVARVLIPSGATGPYVISVTGGGSCRYFNEAANAMVPYAAGYSLHAVVPAAIAANAPVAVTPLTEMQYTYLKHRAGGAITSSVTDSAAVAAVSPVLVLAKSMGLLSATIDVQNMFALPPVMPAPGVTPAQLGQDGYSAMFGIVAAEQPSDPMAAVMAFAAVAKAAALSIASSPTAPQALIDAQTAMGTVLPISQAVSNMYGPASAVGMAAPLSVTAATQAAVADAAVAAARTTASASYLADLTAGGMHLFSPGYQYATATGTATVAPLGKSMTASVTTTFVNTTYSMLLTFKELLNQVWTALVGTSGNTDYVLTAGGWADDRTTSLAAIPNLDGSFTVHDGAWGRYGSKVARVDISGVAIASTLAAVDANGMTTGAAVVPPGNFPAGAVEYDITDFGLTSGDVYQVYAGSLGADVQALDASGIQLTALPAANSQFCVAGFRFVPAAAVGTYDVYANAAAGCPALAAGQLADGTVTLGQKQVYGQSMLAVTATTQQATYPAGYVTSALPGIIAGTFGSGFLALVNGQAYLGTTTLRGADTAVLFGTRKRYNRIAIDAQMKAANLPLL
jgi:hypothetical protein